MDESGGEQADHFGESGLESGGGQLDLEYGGEGGGSERGLERDSDGAAWRARILNP